MCVCVYIYIYRERERSLQITMRRRVDVFAYLLQWLVFWRPVDVFAYLLQWDIWIYTYKLMIVSLILYWRIGSFTKIWAQGVGSARPIAVNTTHIKLLRARPNANPYSSSPIAIAHPAMPVLVEIFRKGWLPTSQWQRHLEVSVTFRNSPRVYNLSLTQRLCGAFQDTTISSSFISTTRPFYLLDVHA